MFVQIERLKKLKRNSSYWKVAQCELCISSKDEEYELIYQPPLTYIYACGEQQVNNLVNLFDSMKVLSKYRQ